MATDPAERQRRSRAHRKGDHSFCDPERCDQAEAVTPVVTTPVTAAASRAPVSAQEAPERVRDAVTGAVTDPVAGDEPEPVPGGIETTTRAFVDTLPYDDGDPRAIVGQIAILLAKRVDDDGAVPAAVRELRTLLMQLAEAPGGPSGAVDEQRLKKAQRKLDGILAGMG